MRMNGQKLQECRMVHKFYRGHQLFPTTNEPQHVYCQMQLNNVPSWFKVELTKPILKLFHLGTKMTLQRNLYPKTGAPALNSTYMYVLLVVKDSPLPKKEKKKNWWLNHVHEGKVWNGSWVWNWVNKWWEAARNGLINPIKLFALKKKNSQKHFLVTGWHPPYAKKLSEVRAHNIS